MVSCHWGLFFSIFQELLPPAVPPPQESTLWAVKAAEKAKYDNIFEVSQLSWKLESLYVSEKLPTPPPKPLKLGKIRKNSKKYYAKVLSRLFIWLW